MIKTGSLKNQTKQKYKSINRHLLAVFYCQNTIFNRSLNRLKLVISYNSNENQQTPNPKLKYLMN